MAGTTTGAQYASGNFPGGPNYDGWADAPAYAPTGTGAVPQVQAQAMPNVNTAMMPQDGIHTGGSYYDPTTQTAYEAQAGIASPDYQSMLGQNGQLKAPFLVDPTQSDAFNSMKATASSTDLSPWAKMQQQSLGLQTAGLRDQTNAQQQGANDQAMQQLMTQGNGSDSGSRALVAAMGSKANIMANQNIGSQAAGQDLGIQQTDAQNKAQMMGQVMNTETGALAANAQSGINDLSNENQFAANRYTQQMQAWGAQQTADAQRASAGGGGKK